MLMPFFGILFRFQYFSMQIFQITHDMPPQNCSSTEQPSKKSPSKSAKHSILTSHIQPRNVSLRSQSSQIPRIKSVKSMIQTVDFTKGSCQIVFVGNRRSNLNVINLVLYLGVQLTCLIN